MWIPSWSADPETIPDPAAAARLLAVGRKSLEARDVPSFGNPISTTAYHPVAMATADLNGDGRLDLITLSPQTGGVAVMLGKGNGHFGSPIYSPAVNSGYTPTALAVADFNGDGKLDVVTANDPGDGAAYGMKASVSVLLGNGNGAFQTFQLYRVLAFVTPSSIAVADFNGDGRSDLSPWEASTRTRLACCPTTAPAASRRPRAIPSEAAARGRPRRWPRATSTATAGPTSP